MTNPLQDIHHYSPVMTISQVMKFCEKKNIQITRAMIQNYVRDKLLPPPVNKRMYTHNHMATLVLIDRLKTVFDLPTIQAALKPYMTENGIPIETYTGLMTKLSSLNQQFQSTAAPALSQEDDGGRLLIMAQATALKAQICR